MPTSDKDSVAVKAWFTEKDFWVQLDDGRQIGVPLTFYPRLLEASPDQRRFFEISGGGRGIHWAELDEDLSVQGLVLGFRDRTAST